MRLTGIDPPGMPSTAARIIPVAIDVPATDRAWGTRYTGANTECAAPHPSIPCMAGS